MNFFLLRFRNINKNAVQEDTYRPLINRMMASASRGVSTPGGVSALGVSALGRLLWGVSAPGGSARGGCGIPACTEADPPSGQNHRHL